MLAIVKMHVKIINKKKLNLNTVFCSPNVPIQVSKS